MSTRRSGLGRGLEALITAQPDTTGGFALIRVDRISPNPSQPREVFDADALDDLARSVSQVGVLQPIVVRPGPDGGYLLIAGERRWRAARQVGLEEIPAVVRDEDDESALAEALIENIQREDLNPLEQAAGYQQLLEDFGLTHEKVAERVGKSRSSVTNTLRLLSLPASIQGLLVRGELTAGHARALLSLEERATAESIARRAAKEGWSVRQVEDAVRDRAAPKAGQVRHVRPAAIIELEERLQERLGSPVAIQYRGDQGRIVIRFGALDELERIYRYLFSGDD